MAKVETVGSTNSASTSRISAHTHISGLGLDENGDAIVPMEDGSVSSSGLIGQVAAREALGIVSDLVHSQRLAGRALLLVGPPGMFCDCQKTTSNGSLGMLVVGSCIHICTVHDSHFSNIFYPLSMSFESKWVNFRNWQGMLFLSPFCKI